MDNWGPGGHTVEWCSGEMDNWGPGDIRLNDVAVRWIIGGLVRNG